MLKIKKIALPFILSISLFTINACGSKDGQAASNSEDDILEISAGVVESSLEKEIIKNNLTLLKNEETEKLFNFKIDKPIEENEYIKKDSSSSNTYKLTSNEGENLIINIDEKTGKFLTVEAETDKYLGIEIGKETIETVRQILGNPDLEEDENISYKFNRSELILKIDKDEIIQSIVYKAKDISEKFENKTNNSNEVIVKLFYYDIDDEGLTFTPVYEIEDIKGVKSDTEILEHAFEDTIKEEYGFKQRENDFKILNAKKVNDNMSVISFTEGFENHGLGSGYESYLIQSVVNTVGNYFKTDLVKIMVNDRLYESGHLDVLEDGFSINKEDILNSKEND